MQAARIFAWAAIVLIFLHLFGPGIMIRLSHSHVVVKALVGLALVVIVEFGIWAAAAGPSDLIRRLQDNPQGIFQDMKASILKLSLIHLLLIVFIISIILTR